MRAFLRLLFFFFFILASYFAGALPGFIVNADSACTNYVFILSDTTSGPVSSYNWAYVYPAGSGSSPVSFTGGSFAHFSDTATGSYEIFETVTIGTVTVTSSKVIKIYQSVVSFSTSSPATDTILSCPGKVVNFINQSFDTGCTAQFTWDFHNVTAGTDTTVLTSSISASVPFTFSVPGYYNITLVENTICDCIGHVTLDSFIKIETPALVCFTDSSSNACGPPDSVYFRSGCTTGAGSFVWHFGNGDTSTRANPSEVFTASGTYNNTLIAISPSGCRDSLKQIGDVVVGNFVPSFSSVTSTCFNASGGVGYIGVSAPDYVGFSWFFHDASFTTSTLSSRSGYIDFFHPGVYTLIDSTWDVTTGCHGVAVKTINVHPQPSVTFTATPAYSCMEPLASSFTAIVIDTTGIDSLHWNFGDPSSGVFDTSRLGSPSHTYTATGYYTPTLIVKDSVGCEDSVSLSNYIAINPPVFTLSLSSDSACTPDTLTYMTSLSPSVGYTIDSVSYGDGSPEYHPPTGSISGMHVYTAQGVFSVIVTYTLPLANGGCSYTVSKPVKVGSVVPVFTPSVVPNPVCPNVVTVFSATCSSCTSFYWNFGNGMTGTHIVDSTTYTLAGTGYAFAVGDINGCTSTVNFHVSVFSPDANIAFSEVNCENNTFRFYNTTTSGVTGYYWSFGDGATSTLAAPSHSYTVPATGQSFTIALVDTGGGTHHCTNFDTTVVNVYPFIDTPVHASDTAVCRLVGVTFSGPVSVTGAAYYEYIWTFSSPSTGAVTDSSYEYYNHVTYAFNDTGIYNVRLVLVNNYGCTDTLGDTSRIHVSGPIGGFSVSDSVGCAPLTVDFIDHNTFAAGSYLTSRRWQFSGPGSTPGLPGGFANGYGADTFYTYPGGTYRVTLIDSDNNHCFSYNTATIRAGRPNAYITASNTATCMGKPLVFTDTNTHCTYTWIFGDGTSGSGQVATHSYAANGTYLVYAVVTTDSSNYLPYGCVDTSNSIIVHIANIPAGFTFVTDSGAICPPLYTLAQVTSAGAYNYFWEVNGVPFVAGSTFSNTFYSAGIYVITLLDSNANGCKDSVSSLVTILQGPEGYIIVSKDSGCMPLSVNIHFVDTGSTAVIPDFTWITGDDSIYYYVDTPGVTHTYAAAGRYIPSTIISNNVCSIPINSTDTITVFPLPVVAVPGPGLICYGEDTLLAATGGLPGDTYSWSPGYALSNTDSASVVATPSVTTTYTVTVTNVHTCTYSVATTVAVDSDLTLSIAGKDSICLGGRDTLYALGVYGNYLWTPDTALSSATHDTVIVIPFQTRTYTVVASDNRGCSATGKFTVTVNPLPAIVISPADPYVCRGDSAQIFASGAGPGGSYVWSPGAFVDDTTIFNPFVQDTADFTLKVVATTIYGCKDSDIDVRITVYDSAYTTISNDTVICAGTSAQLLATSTSGSLATYLWTPGATLSDPASPDPTATPDTTTLYSVYIQENPCFHADRSVTVYVVPNPEILLPPASTLIAGSSIQLTAVVGNTADVTQWAWTPDATLSCDACYNPVATPTATTTYVVTGTTPIGCTRQSSVEISLVCIESSQVFVPNTFTPNGDGVNDRFYLSGRGLGLITRMSIYDRWGQQVFEAENINANDRGAGWDGTFKGQVLPPGVFVYVFELLCETGVPFTLKGDISIVR